MTLIIAAAPWLVLAQTMPFVSLSGWDFGIAVALAIAVFLVEIGMSVAQRTPLWLLRNSLGAMRRLGGELIYLRGIIQAHRERGPVSTATLNATRARPEKGTEFALPLLDQLYSLTRMGNSIVVLGEPGSGKSTVLRVLTYQLAREGYWSLLFFWTLFFGVLLTLTYVHSPWWSSALLVAGLFEFFFSRWTLPLVLDLRRFESGRFDDFLRQNLALRVGGGALRNSLSIYSRRRRLVVFLDGLDEVREAARAELLTGLRDCRGSGHWFATSPIVVTSRHGHDPAESLAIDVSLELWDLDDDGVRAFLHEFRSHDVRQDFDAMQERNLLGGRGLGRNPFWLELMTTTKTFGRNRGTLCHAACRQDLQRESESGRIQHLNPAEGPDVLGHLALAMSEAEQVGAKLDFARQQIADLLQKANRAYTADQILADAQAAGILDVSRRGNWVEFSHPLWQEFFTAFALRRHGERFLKHADSMRWWGTLSLLGGLAEKNLPAIIQRVLSGNVTPNRLHLAIALLQNVEHPDEQAAKHVAAAYVASLRKGVSPEQIQAARQLASIAPDSLAALLGSQFHSPDLAVKKSVLQIVDAIGGDYALSVLLFYRALGDLSIREEATRILVRIGEPAVKPLLAVMWDEKQQLSLEVADVLERIGKPAVEPILNALDADKKADKADKTSVCLPALEVLGWIGDERATKRLVELLQAKQQTDPVRKKAAESLERIGKSAVPRLIEALGHELDQVRLVAAVALGGIRDAEAIEPLIEATRDKNETVRERAVDALGRIADPRAADSLLYVMRNRALPENLRSKAAEALGWLRGDEVVKPLIESLEDKKELVRVRAAIALGRLQDARVVKPLLGPLMNTAEAEKVRGVAAEALEKIGRAAVPPLIAGLRNEDPHYRAKAAEMLGRIPDPRSVEALMNVLHDPDEPVQLEACTALGASGDERGRQALLAVLQKHDEKNQVRARAARALGRFKSSELVKHLLAAIGDADSQVRRGVVAGLGEIGDAQAVEPLIGALKDEDAQVRWETTEALARLGDPRAAAALLARLRDKQENERVRMGAGDALGRTKDQRLVEPLVALLHDEMIEARRGAVNGLGHLGDRRVVPKLVEALRDENYWVRSDAAEALGRLGDHAAVDPLLESLKDENFWVRAEAAKALGNLADLRSVKPLFNTLLQDRRDTVRTRAAESLGKIGNPWAFKPLACALRDESDDVRAASATALGLIGDRRAVPMLCAALQIEADMVRAKAALALGQLGDPNALPTLETVAADTRHRSVAESAAKAIQQIRPEAAPPAESKPEPEPEPTLEVAAG